MASKAYTNDSIFSLVTSLREEAIEARKAAQGRPGIVGRGLRKRAGVFEEAAELLENYLSQEEGYRA